MQSAIINDDGIVINIIRGEALDAIACPEKIHIGWVYQNGIFAPPTIDLATYKVHAIKQVRKLALLKRAGICDYSDPYKTIAWAEKLQRAERIVAGEGTTIDSQLVQAECDQRDLSESVMALAQKQCDKGHALADKFVRLEGLEHKAMDDVKAATEPEAVKSIAENFSQQLAAITGDNND